MSNKYIEYDRKVRIRDIEQKTIKCPSNINDEIKYRICIGCGKKIRSMNPGHRRCSHCKVRVQSSLLPRNEAFLYM